MLKCEIESGIRSKLETSGKIADLIGESLTIIKMVYNAVHDDNPELAELYRQCLVSVLADLNGPVWFHDERPIGAMFEVESKSEVILQ